MNGPLETILAATLAWCAVFGTSSLIAAITYRAIGSLDRAGNPGNRSMIILAFGLLPVLAASLVSMVLYFPGLTDMVLPEHCHAAGCAPHPPETAISALAAAAITASIAMLIILLYYSPLNRLGKHLRKSKVMGHFASDASQGTFKILDSSLPIALCDGLWRPSVYVSQGLIDQLNDDDLSIVIAHEQHHAIRHDNLAGIVLEWSTILWPRRIRRRALQDFSTMAEFACDEAAARVAGRREKVAALLKKLRRIAPDDCERETIDSRVDALSKVRSAPYFEAVAPWLFLLTLWLLSAYVLTHSAHVLLEAL